jgi:hypothetical protein
LILQVRPRARKSCLAQARALVMNVEAFYKYRTERFAGQRVPET